MKPMQLLNDTIRSAFSYISPDGCNYRTKTVKINSAIYRVVQFRALKMMEDANGALEVPLTGNERPKNFE